MDEYEDPQSLSAEEVLLTLSEQDIVQIDKSKSLLIVAKSMLISLRLRNIDANNIVALASILGEKSNAK